MAVDSWVPRRFAVMSDRLTTQNGVLLMGAAALAALLYTGGNVGHIVVMYSINVFLTFTMTELSMCKMLIRDRKTRPEAKRRLPIHVAGLLMCVTILAVTVHEKFFEGGWITLMVTGVVVALCLWIKRYYRALNAKLAALYASLHNIEQHAERDLGKHASTTDPKLPTAVVLVGGYSGLGIHTAFAALRAFPGHFGNVVFVTAGVIDSGAFKGEHTLEDLRESTGESLTKYVSMMRAQGVPADSRLGIGTDVVQELEKLCLGVVKDYPRATFFAGQLVFQQERWYQRILHNQTAYVLQKRLQLAGHTMVILPARVR
jgi:hypothetical protein